jgi:peptidoglycan/LPS O-acetylase OafA/YrhL
VLVLAAARVAMGALPQTIQFDPWMQAAGYPLVNALFAALLVLAVAGREGGWWRALLQQGWLQWLGRYSYAMYLFNLPVRWVLEQILGRPEDLPLLGDRLIVQALYYPAGFALTGAAAWVSWQVLEGPCLRLKARFGGAGA